ncbi:MAG: hypothetical protein P0Y59_14465 [Candidatus Sphingomonas phytovorans]|nr:hypothetical protein [Sphingomonas sp.]WEJ98147.1 MAG: hypothetical protein P0Y59_14465 [Sphingomonas sp.]
MTVSIGPRAAGQQRVVPPAPPPAPEAPRADSSFDDLLGGMGTRFVADFDGAASGTDQDAGVGGHANMFNADGFFQGATALPGQPRVADPSVDIVAPVPAVDIAGAIAAAADPAAPGTVPAVHSLPSPAAAVDSRPRPTPGTASMISGKAVVPMPPEFLADAPAAAPRPEKASASPSSYDTPSSAAPDIGTPVGRRLLARLFATRGAALSARVAVREVEQGLQISMQLGELEPADRLKLRDRVVALLSRHGLAAKDITINGDSRTIRAGTPGTGTGGQ